MRPGQGADVQSLTGRGGQSHDADAEAVAPCRWQVLHQPAARQRRQYPRDAADVDPGAPRDLVGAKLGLRLSEDIENGDRTLDGSNMAGSGLSGSGHGSMLSLEMEMLFPSRQLRKSIAAPGVTGREGGCQCSPLTVGM